jgi:YYY domain-containing protein
MIDILTWWFLIELIGIAVLPVAFRFFRNLPDRGYAFAKPLGLLLIAYPFWLLTTLGFLTNTRGAVALVAVSVAALSWWLAGRPQTTDDRPQTNVAGGNRKSKIENQKSVLIWLQQNKSLLLSTELVFTLAFLAWTFVRAYMPEITATEKPMEFALLNGVLQSERFPPLDPWLSGYAISYYYFGYVIVALLTTLSGVAPSVAFNLAIASLFALSAVGAFGLAYNLIQNSKFKIQNSDPPTSNFQHPTSILQSPISTLQSLFFALFAPIFLLLIGNLEGLFEALHTRGIGSPGFWDWLDVKGLAQAPTTNTFVPTDNWWWWRASRVIHDVALGQTQEVIDEFPQFSFLLGDMHPHVLALPFVLLALAAALNLLKSRLEIRDWRLEIGDWNVDFVIRHLSFVIYPLILGGLFFLNSWDILPYGFILLAAFAFARYRAGNGWDARATRDLATFAIGLGAFSVILYLPFYIGFQSQAGGILPTLLVKTRLHQYLLMFGVFVFVLGALLARLFAEHRAISLREWTRRAAPFLAASIAFPTLIAVVALGLVTLSPTLREQARAAMPNAPDNIVASVVAAYFGPWVFDPWLFVLLALFLAAILVLARARLAENSTTFALLLAFTGFLLTFGVEFVYLRDSFGTRMNTVFKFYFQAWTLFSIASAYGVFYLSRALNGIARGAWFVALALLLGASLVYPALAIPNRADGFKRTPTLDGIAWIREYAPGDYAAIQWLHAHAPRGATILEAPGGEYSYGNRISVATGLPTILGWAGHELQWRGNSKLFQDDAAGVNRAADAQRIYQSLDAKETLTLLDKYDIKFVVVGQTERSQYGLTKTQVDKFGKVMTLVFENGDVRIYARST